MTSMPLAEHGDDPSLIAIDQHIVDGEERIARITHALLLACRPAASTRALLNHSMPR
jgi:hypothetical protein